MMQTGRRFVVVLVVATVLGSTVVGFTAAVTNTSATQVEANESVSEATSEQPATEVATSVDQSGETNGDETTDVDVTTRASPEETPGADASTGVAATTDTPTSATPTATPSPSDPTVQEPTVETPEPTATTSNEPAESASESTEQPTADATTSAEPTDEATAEPSSEGTATATTEESVDAGSTTTVVPGPTDAVTTATEREETVASDDSEEPPVTGPAETTQSDDENRPVADTAVPSPGDTPESARTVADATEAPKSVVNTVAEAGESFEEPTESVEPDQPTETATVGTGGENGSVSGNVPSNATESPGDPVETVEGEIESVQVDDTVETTEYDGDMANDATDDAGSANETVETPSGSTNESADDVEGDAGQVFGGAEDDTVAVLNETVDDTVESASITVPENATSTSIEPTFEKSDDVNVSSIDDSSVVTNESDPESAVNRSEENLPAIDADETEPLDEGPDESVEATDEVVNATIDSTGSAVTEIEANVTNESAVEESADGTVSTVLDDSVAVVNGTEDEVASLNETDDSGGLDGSTDELTDATDQVDGTINSTANAVGSVGPTFDEPAGETNLSSLDDSTTVTNDSEEVLASLDAVDDLESVDGVADEPTPVTSRTDELTDVLESDSVEDVTDTTDETAGTVIDGAVDPSLAQLEETVNDTVVESSTATTDAQSRTTDLLIDGTDAASETLETENDLVGVVDGTLDGTESGDELADLRLVRQTLVETTDLTGSTVDRTTETTVDLAEVELLDGTIYATYDLAGTVEYAGSIASDADSIDATVEVGLLGGVQAALSVDGELDREFTDLTVETTVGLPDSTDGSVEGVSSSTVPDSWGSSLTVARTGSTESDGRTAVASSHPEAIANPIDPVPTATGQRADATRIDGTTGTAEENRWNDDLLAPGRTVDPDDGEWADATRIRQKSSGGHPVARPMDDGSVAESAVASGQSNYPDEGGPSPFDDSGAAALGLATVVAGAAAGRFAGNAWSLQPALNPSMVRLQLRAGVHSIQCWCGQLSLPRIGPIPGYSQYDDSDPLENEVRAEVYESIEGSPGVYLTRLSEESSVPRSTVRYHVRVLESEGLVSAAKVRGRRRFFPAGSDEIELATALSDDATAAVLDAVVQLEPASGSRIAERLERDPSTVSHHLKRLSEAGLVVREREGCAVLNRLSPTVRETLVESDHQSAPREAKV